MLLSPINSIPCVYYSVVIRKRYGQGEDVEWEEIVRETSEQHFELLDISGKIVIEPRQSEFFRENDQHYTPCYDSSEFEPEFLKRHDSELPFSSDIAFYEEIILENDLLLAMGRGEQKRSSDGELRLHMRHQERTPLQISNAPSLLSTL